MASEGDLRKAAVAGWYFIDVQGGATPETVSALESQTNGSVMPVFRDRYGYPLVFSPVINIRFESGVGGDEVGSILGRFAPASIKPDGWIPGLYRVELKEKNGYRILDIANELAALPQVRFATPNSLITGRKDFTPNDPYFDRQWGLGSTGAYPVGWGPRMNIRAVQAWDATVGQPSIKTAVIDDGIQLNHPDIAIGNAKDFVPQIDPQGNIFYGDGGPLNDFDNHGTVMGGLIGASINNGRGIAGVAGGAKVVSARAHVSVDLDAFQTSPEIVRNAMLWIQQIGCRITNNSNSYGASDPLIEEAYLFSKGAGIVHFVAAGNTGGTSLEEPADLETVNAVTGVLPNGVLSPGASTGEGIKFSAPGAFNIGTDRTGTKGYPPLFNGSILSADGNYVLFDSAFMPTSFACAYASGVAALVLSVNPTLSPDQVSEIMAATALDIFEPPGVTPDRIGYDDRWGWGMIDAARAVSAALPATLSVKPNPVKGGLKTKLRLTMATPPVAGLTYLAYSDDQAIVPLSAEPIDISTVTGFGEIDVETAGVDSPVDVNLNVELGNIRRTSVLTVIPATLNRLALSRATVYGGESLSGQVDLAGRAGPSGATYTISDDSAFVTAPAQATVAAQATRGIFPITTLRTTTTRTANISVTLRGFTLTKPLTLTPVLTDIQSFTVSPNTVMGGGRPIGTVTMTQNAPAGGAVVGLSDANTATSFVASITIPQGQKVGTFTIYTGPVSTTSYTTIKATYFGVSKTANLTITPTLWVTSLTVTPSVVRGGFGAVGRIEIYSNAPTGGVPVSVTDTNSYVSTPLTVWVPAGRRWVEFPITTYATNTTVTGDVRASYGGVTKVAPITVYK